MASNNYFDLTLKTIAPKGSIKSNVTYTNTNVDLELTYGDATYMKVWFNESASATADDAASVAWEAPAAKKTTAFTAEGTYYYHLLLVDNLGNESEVYTAGPITFDQTKPVIDKFVISDEDSGETDITNSATVDYVLNIKDISVSGIASAVISGDCTEVVLTNPDVATDLSGKLVLTTGDGSKTVKVTVTDNAGNVSDQTVTITLDTGVDTAVLVLKSGETQITNQYINYQEITAILTSDSTDVVSYKIWEGETEPTEWTSNSGSGTLNVSKDMTLSSGDGQKVINAKIKDAAGNEATASPATVNYDKTAPEVSLTVDKTIISNNDGYNAAELALSGSDAFAGVKSYTLTCGSISISEGTEIPSSFVLTSANSMVEGNNTITLTVVDNAGNSNSASVEVMLDTTAPVEVSIGKMDAWYNDSTKILPVVNYSDGTGSGVEKIAVWVDAQATATIVPTGIADVAVTGSGNPYSPNTTNLAQGQNYVHVRVVDKVGNTTFASSDAFGFDNVAPSNVSVSFSKAIYANTAANLAISATDVTSGNAWMKVVGDITDPTEGEWENYSTARSVTLTSGDGEKIVSVTVKDTAGNISTVATAKTVLDETLPTAALVLKTADGSADQPKYTAEQSFSAQVSGLDDGTGTAVAQYYKLYGDLAYTADGSAITEQEAEWQELKYDDGQTYMTVTGLYCTPNASSSTSGELKSIYLKVKDDAGNVSEAIEPRTFTYDPSEAVISISDISAHTISCVHTHRRTSASEVDSTRYNDEVTFTFTPDSTIISYKVCAFADQDSAKNADGATATAIGNAHGSSNMAATGISASTAVNCKIMGEDLQAQVVNDGLYYIVVFAQNDAGVWSKAAEFTA